MTTLNQVSMNQLQKEVTINENFEALSPVGIFANRGNHNGLTFNYYGGNYQKADGTQGTIADGSIALSDGSTNYVYFDLTTELVAKNTTGFTTGNFPIATVITASGVITSITNKRVFALYAVGTPTNLTYTLPTASPTVKGGVKIDGTTITIDANGVISSTASGGGSVSYVNDISKLKAYAKFYLGSNTAVTMGTYTGSTLTAHTQASANEINTKWGALNKAFIKTTATLNSAVNYYGSNQTVALNKFSKSRGAIKINFGFLSANAYNNSFGYVGVNDANQGLTSIGNSTDFTSIGLYCFGIGWRSGDANLQIVYKNASNVLSFIDLGASFGSPNSRTGNFGYELTIEKNTDASNVFDIYVTDIDSGTKSTVNTITVNASGIDYTASPIVYIKTLEAVQKSLLISDIHVYNWV